ncbi:MAG: hypothetical protein J6B23_06825 [Clostridia bacterium]|nr:hypothetical protein [Clostridia bacterium]
MANLFVSDKDLWQRPFTTKLYLHPPYAEEMCTMWPQFQFMSGDIGEDASTYASSGAIRFLWGEEDNEFDFKAVKYNVRGDGIPVHGYSFDMGDWTISAESFCSIETSPTIFGKLKIKNTSLWEVKETLGMIVRTGYEWYLHGMNDPDGYMSFNPNIRCWGLVPRTWSFDGKDTVSDEKYSVNLKLDSRISPRWQGEEKGLPWHRRGILKLDFELKAGEECELFFALGKGKRDCTGYDENKEKVIAYWLGELDKIKVYPGGDAYKPMIKSLVAQSLQMFCHHMGKYDYVLTRQGCTQRNIWVAEAYHFLMALDRIGDFYSYTKQAYDMYFDILQSKSGEDVGMIKTLSGSNSWAGSTGAAICGLAYHIMQRNDKTLFEEYKDKLYLSFEWIERMRASSGACEGCFEGIMPPAQADDWPVVKQNWTTTDMYSIEGEIMLGKCFEKFGDSRSETIKSAVEDYRKALKKVVDSTQTAWKDPEEFMIGCSAGDVVTDPLIDNVVLGNAFKLARYGVVSYDDDMYRKIINYYNNRNIPQNGLHALMHACGTYNNPWIGYVYYTTTGDEFWFWYYMATGDRQKAWETLKGQLKYSMTKEYYCIERYATNDPYYVPWSPNASANGRIIEMLCDWFGV